MSSPPPDADVRISAVIACYGDGQAIPVMYERLTAVFAQLGVDWEIVFVNDGSPDDSREVLGGLAGLDPHVTVVTHTRPFGSQSAFTSGMRIATGDAVILMDGDLQDPPEVIPELVGKWREGFDVVYGDRVDREGRRTMRAAYKLFYRLFRRTSYVEVPLDAGDFGLMNRRAVDALNGLPEKQRFIRGLRAWVGMRQTGVPYVRPERAFGRSTNNLVKNLGWARRAIISFSYAPLDFIMVLAFLTVGGSVPRHRRADRAEARIPLGRPEGLHDPARRRVVPRRDPTPLPEHHRVVPRPHVRGGEGPPRLRGR